jgi:hypothetical protein
MMMGLDASVSLVVEEEDEEEEDTYVNVTIAEEREERENGWWDPDDSWLEWKLGRGTKTRSSI